MDEKEFNNTYAIPANYTDSGKLLGGMLETRNTIEAIIMLGLVGYPEIAWLHVDTTAKVVIMTVTLIPLGVVSLMGIGGDSLMQYLSHIVRFGLNRRKLHYRRIGYKYGSAKETHKKQKKKKQNKTKIILNLEPDEAEYVRETLKLTRTEIRSITQFERGEALISSNNNKVPVLVRASKVEQQLITTDRSELAAILKERQRAQKTQTEGNAFSEE